MEKEKKTLKEKIIEKKDKAIDRYEKFQLFLSFIGAIYFVVNLILTTKKNYADSNLYPFILVFTIAYVLIFLVFIIIHRNNRKQIKSDTKKFKSTLKIVKLLLNLLFIGSSLLIFIESVNGLSVDQGLLVIIETIFSGLLLFIKLLSTIRKLIKTIKKKIKQNKKEKEKNNKENE